MPVHIVVIMIVRFVVFGMRGDGFVTQPALHIGALCLRIEQPEPEQRARIDRSLRRIKLRRAGIERGEAGAE